MEPQCKTVDTKFHSFSARMDYFTQTARRLKNISDIEYVTRQEIKRGSTVQNTTPLPQYDVTEAMNEAKHLLQKGSNLYLTFNYRNRGTASVAMSGRKRTSCGTSLWDGGRVIVKSSMGKHLVNKYGSRLV
ncbi:MAG: hypothetical protein ACI9CD_000292 [Candidatus Deianiraeaceae bacterium]|jgi:hypothetical protein